MLQPSSSFYSLYSLHSRTTRITSFPLSHTARTPPLIISFPSFRIDGYMRATMARLNRQLFPSRKKKKRHKRRKTKIFHPILHHKPSPSFIPFFAPGPCWQRRIQPWSSNTGKKKSNLWLKRRRLTNARRIFFTNTTTFRIVNTRGRIVNTRGRRIFYKYYPFRIVNIRGRRTIFTITNRESDKRHIFADSIRPC